MTARALLAELDAVGIAVTREGDNLNVRGEPGVSLTPYLDRIRDHKPALLATFHLQDQIVAAASAAQDAFDRVLYDELWQRWHELQGQEANP